MRTAPYLLYMMLKITLKSLPVQTVDLLRRMYTELLSPQQCMLCGNTSNNGTPLCKTCVQLKINPYTADKNTFPRCLNCGRILISETGYCTHCRTELQHGKTQPNSDTDGSCKRIFALYPYVGLGQKIMPAWKNKNMRSFSAVFAPLIADFLHKTPELQGIPVIPVPPRAKKMRQKGWDQIADLCNRLSAYPDIPVYPCLKRLGNTPQKQLSKAERLNNVQGKIRVYKKNVPQKAIVLDDVMTTGSTLKACAQALMQCGCKEVYGLCLFFD